MIHAVLFLLTFNANTLEILHSQVIGGFPTLDACKAQMPAAMAMITPELKADELPQLECSTVKALPESMDGPKTDL